MMNLVRTTTEDDPTSCLSVSIPIGSFRVELEVARLCIVRSDVNTSIEGVPEASLHRLRFGHSLVVDVAVADELQHVATRTPSPQHVPSLAIRAVIGTTREGDIERDERHTRVHKLVYHLVEHPRHSF